MATIRPQHSSQRASQMNAGNCYRLAAAALANALGLKVLFEANQFGGNIAASAPKFVDTGLDHGETFAGIVDLVDLRIEVGDFALHLFGHVFNLPLEPDNPSGVRPDGLSGTVRNCLSSPAIIIQVMLRWLHSCRTRHEWFMNSWANMTD